VNESIEGRCKSFYKGAHEYHINSLNIHPDGECFLSADDLRINIWNISNTETVYNILDIKAKSANDIEEAINYSEFNKANPNMFLYTTSKGFLNICDMREKATFING
jgi:serine/threonine-protein phosphatase 2A regulatory subunit B